MLRVPRNPTGLVGPPIAEKRLRAIGTGFDLEHSVMFVERLLNQGNAPLLERMVDFAATRHRLLAENIVNVDTPGYRQKDLSIEAFQAMLRDRVADRRGAAPGAVGFDDIRAELDHPERGILFHDGNNRSMEQLMTDQAKNALMHNVAIELLRKQFQSLEAALKERIG